MHPDRQWSPDTYVSFPGSQEFEQSTERWTTFSAPTYRAAISPATEEDVAKIVKLATCRNIPFLATSGRHGYTTTLGDLQNGLAIDLSQLNSFELDTTAETLTVGPGVTVGEVFDPLFNAGFDIQTGSAPCPSLIGVTLGGGVGRYQGVYGLIADALVSVRMVTAHGDIIEVSEDSYPDLFWGIRGAGSNFGIITSATYKLHPLTEDGDTFIAEFIVSAEGSPEYFHTLEAMQPLPAELSSIMLITSNPVTNATQTLVHWVYKGREADALAALAPILALDIEVTAMMSVPWNEMVGAAFGGVVEEICIHNINRDLYSFNLKNYAAETYVESFNKMHDYFMEYPAGRNSVLQFEFFPNQAMEAFPQNYTAFPWRDTTGYINFNIIYDAAEEETAAASTALGLELRDDLVATSGFPELTVFVSYAHGDEKLEQIYGADKLPHLAALKKEWDPLEVFSYNNGIPTEYP
ncbi:FAD-binding domain-containing protein [Sodiomyces alkalinus F11]|uniref:FAD-binding domain-containing protein n=1 Tax=Sodiomyces alkalinus (strain CBS 110278 / VKM F-3762 / F11) TaxID=1314773 RepID=A0A3N2PWX7_SODAK|nr:FAD-binding domain-containing protein [Sodiomyces alkalinus F11]ROT38906.1 FAD-binding domain-containing protein [Sodiomyces alkalinus F11]